MRSHSSKVTFKQVSEHYQIELTEDGRGSYAGVLKNLLRLFLDFTHGDVFLSEVRVLLPYQNLNAGSNEKQYRKHISA